MSSIEIGVGYNGLVWYKLHPRASFDYHLGFIPTFLDDRNNLPAAQQIASTYVGGWFPFKGFELRKDGSLKYKGDPPMKPLWQAKLPTTGEVITVYEHAWVQIMQPSGEWEVARLD